MLDQVAVWQEHYRSRFGVSWVYASDEWYLLDERPVPGADDYDGFPQLENGVGLVRQLLDDWTAARRRKRRRAVDSPITLVCGTLVAPLLARLAGELSEYLKAPARALPVVNGFFGNSVTVSGLLTGQDVRRALERENPSGLVFLPRAMFDSEGQLTLDDLTLAVLGSGLDARLAVAGKLSDVVRQK